MSYPINYPRPQGANIQMFYKTDDWVKPQGASFVWFTLIGAGGSTNGGGSGGGSGGVTNCMVPAFLIPDELKISVGVAVSGASGTNTNVIYQSKDGTGYTLLQAIGGSSTTGGSASSNNNFSCMGFFQSVAGQDGIIGAQTASATTFLSGGGNNTNTVTSNYGYAISAGANGFFQTQPIIVGVGGSSNKGGIGCGSGSNNATGFGGDGLAVIITW